MSEIKEVDIRFQFGDFVNPTPGYHGKITISTGAHEANQVWGELQGRFGEDFDSKPVVVLDSENAEDLKGFFEGFEGFCVDSDEEKERFRQDRASFIKPAYKRVGDLLVVTREEPAHEITPILSSFQDVLDGNTSLEFTLELDKTPSTLHQEKNNLLYILHNGFRGRFDAKVTLGLLERLFDMGTQISPIPDPELARSMLNFFKKYTLNLESYDVDTLPGELKEFFKHPMIDSILNPFREEIVANLKEKLLPVLKQFELFGTVRGPIQAYFPVKDTFVIKVEANVADWFNQLITFLESA